MYNILSVHAITFCDFVSLTILTDFQNVHVFTAVKKLYQHFLALMESLMFTLL